MALFDGTRPVILSLSYHDPCGAGGIQADIETTASLGCHCTTVVTALCARDTQEIKDLVPVSPAILIEQTRALLEDMPIQVIKLGYLGDTDAIEAVYTILRDYPKIPVILDPATQLSSSPYASHNYHQALFDLLLPLSAVVVCNNKDILHLAPRADSLEACAAVLLDTGCDHVLVNGCEENHQYSQARLYSRTGLLNSQRWRRLNLTCHGKSDILTSAVAAYHAQGLSLTSAISQGLRFCWEALASSQRLGMGEPIPNRLHWVKTTPKDFAEEIAVAPDNPSSQ